MEPHNVSPPVPVQTDLSRLRTRWAALGAAIAVTLGGGGLGIVQATTSSGDRAIYQPINPCRLADTRPAPDTVGPRPAPLGEGEIYTLSGRGAVGNCNLPTESTALALNVTAVGATAPTFVQLWPAGETRPTTSNLNPTPGAPPTPNAVNVQLSATGEFSVFNRFGSVAVVIDVVGVYDDHTHDDRYYSKEEVDALIAANKPIAASVGGEATVTLGSDSVIRSVTIVAPSTGTIVVNSSAYFYKTDSNPLTARCAITLANNLFQSEATESLQYARFDGTTAFSEVISGTKAYAVTAGDERTINLVCDVFSGQGRVDDAALNAVFIPA